MTGVCDSYEIKPTKIIKNNFMGLKIFASFLISDPSASITTWSNNYWGRPRVLPKLIIGLQSGIIPAQIKIDWNPAKRPF